MNLADLARRIDNLIRIGTVRAVDHQRARVRVRTGKILTNWLPWMELAAGANVRTWRPPTRGEQVLVFCPGGEPATGVVLAGLPCDRYPAPSSDENLHLTAYGDGSLWQYNHLESKHDVVNVELANWQIKRVTHAGDEFNSNGVVLHTHTHTGVVAGEDLSGPPPGNPDFTPPPLPWTPPWVEEPELEDDEL